MELIEALQMLKYRIKRGRPLDFMAGTSRAAEVELLDVIIHDDITLPEDISSFIDSLLPDE